MCEDLLEQLHCPEFPVCILRPAIIGAIAHHPVPGYFGNAAWLTLATLAFATGKFKLTLPAALNAALVLLQGADPDLVQDYPQG